MDKYSLFLAIGEVRDEYIMDAAALMAKPGRHLSTGRKIKRLIVALAAALALLGSAMAVSAKYDINILDFIADRIANIISVHERAERAEAPEDAETLEEALAESRRNVILEQISEGQWVYLNGEAVAVIVPESPAKILLSFDGGATWRESTVKGSEDMEAFGELREGIQYYGGFIGAYGDGGGYLILTAQAAMNAQPMDIYLSSDGGETWTEAPSPEGVHSGVISGAAFASEKLGFVGYRYYEDAGPDIWRTLDGGGNWERLNISIPDACNRENYRFTPGCPVFEGSEGDYPITVLDHTDGREFVIHMYSHDGGLTWDFEE